MEQVNSDSNANSERQLLDIPDEAHDQQIVSESEEAALRATNTRAASRMSSSRQENRHRRRSNRYSRGSSSSSWESTGSEGASDSGSDHRRKHRRRSTGQRPQVVINDDETRDGSESSAELEDEGTVRARQEALNTRHPFGLPIWKPALYKKSRSVTRAAFLALHSRPLRGKSLYVRTGNVAWMVLAGWWLAAVCAVLAMVLWAVPAGGRQYARVVRELGWYLFWPFGRYVERIKNNNCGSLGSTRDPEEQPLLGADARPTERTAVGRAVYYTVLVLVLNPLLITVSAVSWFAVFTIPIGKLTHTLARYLWRDPLSLHFRSGDTDQGEGSSEAAPTVLLCTNEAAGWYYYKYTVDGVNILFYDMLAVAVFVLLAAFVLGPLTNHTHALVQPGVLFPLCLISTIPLAYFIGQAVSSISAQSSLGLGAVINATFGSIVEVILYSIALTQGKSQLVEGALVGSLLAGLMLMPGTSMIAGGIKRKMQRFNAKSAEVTATLIIMSIIGAFAPTLFYHTFSQPELDCHIDPNDPGHVSCIKVRKDYISDPFYHKHVKPFMYVCSVVLPLSYLVALWFSLKTHVKHIYSTQHTSNPILRHVLELFRRTLRHDAQAGPSHNIQPLSGSLGPDEHSLHTNPATSTTSVPDRATTPKAHPIRRTGSHWHEHPANAPSSLPNVPRLSELRRVLAADPDDQLPDIALLADGEGEGEGGGHDAPNWGKGKSAFILCACTVMFSLIAEVLVETVDVVISKFGINEKYIGLTIFALVPNVTEFMNAIAFAVQNNIALSIEISNAYTVQVALLQIPALVLFSAVYGVPDFVSSVPMRVVRAARASMPTDPGSYSFALIFPLWDLIAILFCVFLLTYMLIEGKANYFKGSILCFSYFVWLVSYGIDPNSN